MVVGPEEAEELAVGAAGRVAVGAAGRGGGGGGTGGGDGGLQLHGFALDRVPHRVSGLLITGRKHQLPFGKAHLLRVFALHQVGRLLGETVAAALRPR